MGALCFFLWTGYKHMKVEKELLGKYLINISSDGLRNLANGIPINPSMFVQQQ
jgi:hypothetical protein